MNAAISELLSVALSNHRNDRLGEAEALYRKVLMLAPNNADALHLLGVLHAQLGNFSVALPLIESAIAANGGVASFYSNRGLVLNGLRRFDEALESLNTALLINPKFTDAMLNRGNALKALGKIPEAILQYQEILDYRPADAAALGGLGTLHSQLGQYDLAETYLRRAAQCDVSNGKLLIELGSALRELGRTTEAINIYREGLRKAPESSVGYSNLAVALFESGATEEALENINAAINLDSSASDFYLNRGNIYLRLGHFELALSDYRRALSLPHARPSALLGVGHALLKLNRPDEALIAYESAEQAILENAELFCNQGIAFMAVGDWLNAERSLRKAVSIDPQDSEAELSLGLLLLLLGRFDEGWTKYEARWRCKNRFDRELSLTIPRWDRDRITIAGKTIAVYSEQGLGDTIQFCRFAEWVLLEGGNPILLVQPPLRTLISSFNKSIPVLDIGSVPPTCDFHFPLMSLPLAYKLQPDSIPAKEKYLFAEEERVKRWQQNFKFSVKKRIGVCWAGNPDHASDAKRSIPIDLFFGVLRDICREYTVVSLKRDIHPTAPPMLLEHGVVEVSAALVDFSETAALCEMVDLVISVDTSVAHLAAALGRPTWILVPYAPDFRWMLNRDDSPWYPTVRLFRQTADRQWGSVLENVANEIPHFFTNR